MDNGLNYWLAQLLILVFYVMTLLIYNRARNEYIGGKIGAAINLIMGFLLVLFLSDLADYFLLLVLPGRGDIVQIAKILLRLAAICILFFGGLRFFVGKSRAVEVMQHTVDLRDHETPQPEIEAPIPMPKMTEMAKTVVKKSPKLGRYEVLEQIGRGAMGIVYKGKDPILNRLTAIKTIRFSDEFDEDKVDVIKTHFYREAEVVAKLSHPNIVTIYDVGEDLDLSFLAMEYLQGESLEKYTSQGNLFSVKKCLEIIAQVCDALEYAHTHDIIHRDIKPANIMMLGDGSIKVTDFGIARATTSTKTRTGIIKGTPYYMSPEQTKGLKLSGRSDIFSLGVVFYQLLTGKLPFDGENMAAIMYQITSVNPTPPTEYKTGLNKPILTVLNKALEKDHDKRYAHARDMGKHIRMIFKKMSEIEGAVRSKE
ncbi:serine/threonine protein kinase [bacterium]|nr:serine/threonine protein kinase [bacterium]